MLRWILSLQKPLIRSNQKRLYAQLTYRRFNNNRGNDFRSFLFDPKSRKYIGIAAGGGSIFYLTHLEEAPVSGRRRFIWIPPYLESKIGNYTYKSILSQTQNAILPQNDRTTQRVSRVFSRILEAAYKDPTVDKSVLEGINWKVHVVNDPQAPPNAFVLPGGKVFVFSSMLRICENDDGLATVLSHEFAHQLARHTGENLSKTPIYTALSILLYTLTGVDTFNSILLDGLIKMPASRQMETEADYIGLMIMSRACFNPDESIQLWKRMAEFEKRSMRGAANFEFLSTHPASERRIENMRDWLNDAHRLYNEADCAAMSQHWQQWKNMSPVSLGVF